MTPPAPEPAYAKKSYVLDTNALLEDPNCIEILRNGVDNAIGIPFHVLIELNRLKKEPRLKHLVDKAVESIHRNLDYVTFLTNGHAPLEDTVDQMIVKDIQHGQLQDPILVTNDRILQLIAKANGVLSQEFRSSHPYQSESQLHTGFIEEGQELLPNSFEWVEGHPVMHTPDGPKAIEYEHDVWKVRPRNVYQNLAFELLLSEHLDIVSLQSEAGYGKTFLALAAALYLTLEQKQFEKIYVVKPMIEIGEKMGFLPGDIHEKMEPYIKYLHVQLQKLHKMRPANRIFANNGESTSHVRFNTEKFEALPIGFIRGMNIENAIVIVDETQNLSRVEARALLTRMGENVKCFCLGDTRQVDNPYLNESNNALNWIVRKFIGLPNYGHLVLKGTKSRGPICDAVLKSGL